MFHVEVTETDEVYQIAGEKGIAHLDPQDPPRRRANKKKGLGNFANDRPGIMGTIGRETGLVRLHVRQRTTKVEVQSKLAEQRIMRGSCHTDEHLAYWKLADLGVHHATVCHHIKEWAKDDDGDGINEVYTNTAEGFWTGLRNFLRPFRGVSKHYLWHYVGMHQWFHDTKIVTSEFIQATAFTPQNT
ncbi:transposase [Neolewinella antarctica]|uniref:ISXO2-like transposase domain-containing protein n=1 Tax=Neolewinella antarctica TaxID=442734 RepID=A0ABX0XAA6_9BACT|nr:hypothetical protein [Neolewinella antarctica]